MNDYTNVGYEECDEKRCGEPSGHDYEASFPVVFDDRMRIESEEFDL